jgi:hypothetical protein
MAALLFLAANLEKLSVRFMFFVLLFYNRMREVEGRLRGLGV